MNLVNYIGSITTPTNLNFALVETWCSGGSRISRRGGVDLVGGPWTPEAATFRKFCLSKRKNLDPLGRARRARPPRSANVMYIKSMITFLPVLRECGNPITRNIYPTWKLMCRLTSSVLAFVIFQDFISVFAITIDRFIFINFPLRHGTMVTRRVVFVTVMVFIIMAIPPVVYFIWIKDRYGQPYILFKQVLSICNNVLLC